MSKSDPIEQALNALGELRLATDPEAVCNQLRAYLKNRSNLVAAKAAKIAGELHASQLIPDMVAAFDRFMANAPQLDKRCAAVTAIVDTLYELDYREPDIYLRGLQHVQKEASFGPPVDTAAALRGMCAQGLVRTRYRDALLDSLPILVDPEPPARLGAIRAFAVNGGEAGMLLLRLKALTGDSEPEVLGECFSGLLAAAPESSLPFVAKYIDDDDDATAEVAIWALGESRLKAALDVLTEKWERTIGRPRRKVLLTAIAALRLEESLAFLQSLLPTANVTTASDLIVALAIYRSNESITRSVAAIVRERGEKPLVEMFEHHFQV
jgi:hypothetical protein